MYYSIGGKLYMFILKNETGNREMYILVSYSIGKH